MRRATARLPPSTQASPGSCTISFSLRRACGARYTLCWLRFLASCHAHVERKEDQADISRHVALPSQCPPRSYLFPFLDANTLALVAVRDNGTDFYVLNSVLELMCSNSTEMFLKVRSTDTDQSHRRRYRHAHTRPTSIPCAQCTGQRAQTQLPAHQTSGLAACVAFCTHRACPLRAAVEQHGQRGSRHRRGRTAVVPRPLVRPHCDLFRVVWWCCVLCVVCSACGV